MIINRDLSKAITKATQTFPALVVTGPRQSGKTTLLKHLFSKASYLNLELPDVRDRALNDPNLFLNSLTLPVILDEIQYAPDLLHYIKDRIDQSRKPAQWLLSGSQVFPLMKGVTESLAGRIAVFSLLPLTFNEKTSSDKAIISRILRGNYPEILLNPKVDRQIWLGSYITTYLERDVRNLENVGDLRQFEIFLRLLATKTAQLLDQSELAKAIGVSVPTIDRWLSILEASYQIFLLYPYYRNIGKRLVKSPKIYFSDTGLASYLLGITTESQLVQGPSWGALFETAVISDLWKQSLHQGLKPPLYFLRTYDGLEIDLVIDQPNQLSLLEIKATATISTGQVQPLEYALKSITVPARGLAVSLSSLSGYLTPIVQHVPIGELKLQSFLNKS